MSLDNEMDSHDHLCSMVDDEAYEPTYAEAFPPLPPVGPDTVDPLQDTAVSSQWAASANKMAVRSSAVTQVNR